MNSATRKIEELIRRSSIGQPILKCRLVIAGTRGLMVDQQTIWDAVDMLLDEDGIVPTEVVSGCARGVDRGGENWAAAVGLPIKRFPVTQADWAAHGASAGPRRNAAMAEYADALLAFHDGQSRGTANMVEQMRDRGKPFRVVLVKR